MIDIASPDRTRDLLAETRVHLSRTSTTARRATSPTANHERLEATSVTVNGVAFKGVAVNGVAIAAGPCLLPSNHRHVLDAKKYALNTSKIAANSNTLSKNYPEADTAYGALVAERAGQS